ncbi:mannose-1-phosphate guanylyltransferase [candidate division KSB1 bacterium]|nr:MAG: mannose-1-phosphate guanylyltransferase [candidate division KSB1 bacterium]
MYGVIIAGGSGTRFWPRSRQKMSKQFLTIFGKKPLISQTIERIEQIIPHEHMYVISVENQREQLLEVCKKIPAENLIFEPVGKNTAPCIGLVAQIIYNKNPDGVMVVSPADHLVVNVDKFRRVIKKSIEIARDYNGLVTLGIKPDTPATGYGYIQIDKPLEIKGKIKAFNVKTFAEKPNLETAKRFLKSGDFFWNSGVFIFRAETILNAFEEFLPEVYQGLQEIGKYLGTSKYPDVLKKVYKQIRSISIDYGIMEKASNVYLVESDFGWSDLGSWEQVYRLSPKDSSGNVKSGDVLLLDTKDSYVYSSEGITALLGVDNLIVVRSGDSVLVAKRERSEDVKKLVDIMKQKRFKKYV